MAQLNVGKCEAPKGGTELYEGLWCLVRLLTGSAGKKKTHIALVSRIKAMCPRSHSENNSDDSPIAFKL